MSRQQEFQRKLQSLAVLSGIISSFRASVPEKYGTQEREGSESVGGNFLPRYFVHDPNPLAQTPDEFNATAVSRENVVTAAMKGIGTMRAEKANTGIEISGTA